MVGKPEVLALIPARGGSKGIPRKNIRDFAGAPLIAYSIAAALQAQHVTRVIVSTDDEEIAAVARQWGAETPFLRPTELAQDDITDLPVFQQALAWLAEYEAYHPEFVVQLRPTSPVRPVGLIDDAIELMLTNPQADCVRGVVPSGQNPFKMWRIEPDSHQLKPLLSLPNVKEPYNAPRQELPKTYWQTGHIDVIRTSTILEKGSLTGDVILPILIDPRYTVDIDTPSDMARYAGLMQDPELKPIDPLKSRRQFPSQPKLLVMDFDGVFTDDTVITDQDGRESVICSRSDGFGLDMLRQHGKVHALILSREENPVVSARAHKLKLEVYQGVQDKAQAIQQLIKERNLAQAEVIYIGNDLNDLPVLPYVGYFACPQDAHSEVIRRADLVLSKPGGCGAIRELVEIILRSEHES
ncbi:MAG TPA: acylneuraminate cytidylyltransferase [Anaerolineaceae bacterium]|nr:acylneuraminate cytidylyltransferase [Anaerolineaceae bacterium]